MKQHSTGYVFQRGGKRSSYYVGWYDRGRFKMKVLRDEHGQAIKTKPEAELAKAEFMAPMAMKDEAAARAAWQSGIDTMRAKADAKQNPPLLISQAWTAFISSSTRPDSGTETLYQYESQWTAFADWMQKNHPDLLALRDVTTQIAEEYAASLNRMVSGNTFNQHINLLMLVFRVLQLPGNILKNPWLHPKKGGTIARKNAVTNSRRELTLDELKKVCDSATGELRTLLALGVYSGLRLGDCATLRWGEVDLRRGLITRIPNKTARQLGPDRQPKKVIVPIHVALHDLLSKTPVAKRVEYVLPDTSATYKHRTDKVTDQVQAHFRACGIQTWKPGTGKQVETDKQDEPHKKGEPQERKRAVIEVGFHSLRHSFVSLCRASNVPLSVVEALVGHNNPAMTRHYTHTGIEAATNAVALLPAVIGDAKPVAVKLDADALRVKVREIAESMTAKNWRKQRDALLALMTDSNSRS